MRIKFLKPKREDEYLQHFLDFYLPSNLGTSFDLVTADCPDANSAYTAPDYFLIEPGILLEIKEVHDRKENENMGTWGASVKWLKQELDSRDKSVLGGTYLVRTPSDLKIRRENKAFVIDQILIAIKEGLTDITIQEIGTFEISKVGKDNNVLAFSMFTGVRAIDSVATVYDNLATKITTANRQLLSINDTSVSKRILLLVNKYAFGEQANFIEALARNYNEMLTRDGVDEIWLIFQSQDKSFLSPELLYSKDFLKKFDSQTLDPTSENIKLFQKWFYPLEKQGETHKEKLFQTTKSFLRNAIPHELIEDDFTREQMVQLGKWLIDNERHGDAVWIIDKFINDIDPGIPEDYVGDPQFNYHKRIEEGEDPRLITTVLGHLSWVVQRLCSKPEYVQKALAYTSKLMEHPNLYVKLQAMVPLIELSARRQLLRGWNERPYRDEYKQFHEICFKLLNLINHNRSYVALADSLCHVFAYYKDMDTNEAIKALEALKISDESAGLFVYFGIYRKKHYVEQSFIKFDGDVLEEVFKNTIQDESPDHKQLVASIAWHLWKILSDKQTELAEIIGFVNLLLKQEYYPALYGDIEMIVESSIEDHTEIGTEIFLKMLRQIGRFVSGLDDVRKKGGIWITTENIVRTIAKNNPVKLLEIVRVLTQLIQKWVFVGNIREIFESYKIIEDPQLQKKMKKEFKNLYDQIESYVHSSEKVDWN